MDDRQSPGSSRERDHAQTEPTGFLSLPLELREQIYCLSIPSFKAPTYMLYRHATATQWSFRHGNASKPPALLLVCRQLRREVANVLDREFEGPLLRINPIIDMGIYSLSPPELWDIADETQCVFALEGLLSAVRTVRLDVTMTLGVADQDRVLAVLEWVVAALGARDQRRYRAEVKVVSESTFIWQGTDAYWEIFDGGPYGELDMVTYSRPNRPMSWQRETRLEELCGSRKGRLSRGRGGQERLKAAREALRESCRRERKRMLLYEQATRKPTPLADLEAMVKLAKANCSSKERSPWRVLWRPVTNSLRWLKWAWTRAKGH